MKSKKNKREDRNMKKRNYLVPLAALAGVFASNQATANMPTESAVSPDSAVSQSDALNAVSSEEGRRIIANDQRDMFSFILKRDSGGNMMAYHESHYSHYSHESHSSHSSHSSHYSGY